MRDRRSFGARVHAARRGSVGVVVCVCFGFFFFLAFFGLFHSAEFPFTHVTTVAAAREVGIHAHSARTT